MILALPSGWRLLGASAAREFAIAGNRSSISSTCPVPAAFAEPLFVQSVQTQCNLQSMGLRVPLDLRDRFVNRVQKSDGKQKGKHQSGSRFVIAGGLSPVTRLAGQRRKASSTRSNLNCRRLGLFWTLSHAVIARTLRPHPAVQAQHYESALKHQTASCTRIYSYRSRIPLPCPSWPPSACSAPRRLFALGSCAFLSLNSLNRLGTSLGGQ